MAVSGGTSLAIVVPPDLVVVDHPDEFEPIEARMR